MAEKAQISAKECKQSGEQAAKWRASSKASKDAVLEKSFLLYYFYFYFNGLALKFSNWFGLQNVTEVSRLQISGLAKSSGYVEISSSYNPYTVAQEGNTLQGNTKREFNSKITTTLENGFWLIQTRGKPIVDYFKAYIITIVWSRTVPIADSTRIK